MARITDCFRQHEQALTDLGFSVPELQRRIAQFRDLDGMEPPVAALTALEEVLEAIGAEKARVLGQVPAETLEQPAFHGTPHKVDRFSLQKIGTGEGAQAYGWGLYFAESRSVAEDYQRTLSARQSYPSSTEAPAEPGQLAYQYVNEFQDRSQQEKEAFYRDNVIEEVTLSGGDTLSRFSDNSALLVVEDGMWVRAAGVEAFKNWDDVKPTAGNLYTVDIADGAVENMLDWDAPLSEQPAAVQKSATLILDNMRSEVEANADIYGDRTQEYLDEIDPTVMTGAEFMTVLSEDLGEQGASEYLLNNGISGVKYWDGDSRAEGEGTRNFVVWDEDAITMLEENGQPVSDQTKSEVLNQPPAGQDAPRGSITIPPGGLENGRAVIRLFDGADFSTVVHEAGHYFLRAYQTVVRSGRATEQQLRDFRILMSWLEVSDMDALTEAQQERFARAFEQYILEGKAPSAELESAFARFRSWMLAIYKSVRDAYFADVNLTDDVRDVFGRMLVADQKLEDVKNFIQYGPLIEDVRDAAMSETERKRYLTRVARANVESRQALESRLLVDAQRKQQQEYRETRELVQAVVLTETSGNRGYQAWEYLRVGSNLNGRAIPEGMRNKMRKSDIVALRGEDWLRQQPASFRRLYRVDDAAGESLDRLSEVFGLPSGDALLEFLTTQPTYAEAVQAETDVRMEEQFPDIIRDTEALEAEAMKAAHNDARVQLLEQEVTLLAKQAGVEPERRRPPPAKVGLQIAQRRLDQMSVADARQYQRFARAEGRQGKETEKYLLSQDYAKASISKRNQLIQHHLTQASLQARDDVRAGVEYLKRFRKESIRKNIHADYLAQIDILLSQYEFTKSISPQQRGALRDFVQNITETDGVYVAPRVLDDIEQRSYKKIPLGQFKEVVEAVENLAHLGRTLNKLNKQKNSMTVEQAKLELFSDAQHKKRTPIEQQTVQDRGFTKAWGNLSKGVDKVHAAHLRPEFLWKDMEDNRADGAWTRYFFRPLADAENAKLIEMEKLIAQLTTIFRTYSEQPDSQLSRRFHVERLGRDFDKETLLVFALNWGNQTNREAVLAGWRDEGWTEEDVQASLVEKLTKEDWDFVESMWSLIDSYWPQIEAMQRRTSGVVPPKIQPAPFRAGDRVIRGGYYPIMFDASVSQRIAELEKTDQTERLFGTNTIRISTPQGHTIERQKASPQNKVSLQLMNVSRHLEQVVHDLTHREAILQVHKLLRDKEVAQLIKETQGNEVYQKTLEWLAHVARPEVIDNRLLRWVMTGATISYMGLNFSTGVQQLTGFSNSADAIGEKYLSLGMKLATESEQREFAMQSSVALRNRKNTFDRDVGEAQSRLERELDGTLKGKLSARMSTGFFFSLIAGADMMVSVPTWLGAYRQATEEKVMNHDDAVAYADSIVRTTQSSGSPKDMADVQRGPALKKLFTQFYTFFGMMYGVYNNKFKSIGRKYKQGEVLSATMDSMKAFVYLIAIPSIGAELLAGRGPEEDESWAKWAATKLALFPASTVVGLRDVARYFETGFRYEAAPAFGVVGDTAQLLRRLYEVGFDDEEFTRSDARRAAINLAVWTHLPGVQAYKLGEYVYEWMNGDLNSPNLLEGVMQGVRGDRDD